MGEGGMSEFPFLLIRSENKGFGDLEKAKKINQFCSFPGKKKQQQQTGSRQQIQQYKQVRLVEGS